MGNFGLILFLCMIFSAITLTVFFIEGKNLPGIFSAVVFFVSFVALLSLPSRKEPVDLEKEAAALKQRQLDAVPRKLSSVDGCTVYTFKPQDRWLYFTKCENSETTTTNEYVVKSGKTTRVEQMEIKTK